MKLKIINIAFILLCINIAAQPSNAVASKLISSTDTTQYAIGAFVGKWMATNGFTITDATIFKKGMDDVLQKRPLAIVDSTITPRIVRLQQKTVIENRKLRETEMFVLLKSKPGVGMLPNGVFYIPVKMGIGNRPNISDSVVINTIGTFADGVVFEDTYQKKQAIRTTVKTLIPGLSEAIQLMPEGSIWRLFLPANTAYGVSGLGTIIPPNTALVFDINLTEVKTIK